MTTELVTRDLYADAQAAATAAYEALTVGREYDAAEIHRLKVCYEASDLIVENLVARGYQATHVIHNGTTVGEHSYVTVGNGTDIKVIDATWQQFLSPLTQALNAPWVLIGSRQEVTRQAQSYGVVQARELWDESLTISQEEQRARDRAAEYAAEAAAGAGKWEAWKQ